MCIYVSVKPWTFLFFWKIRAYTIAKHFPKSISLSCRQPVASTRKTAVIFQYAGCDATAQVFCENLYVILGEAAAAEQVEAIKDSLSITDVLLDQANKLTSTPFPPTKKPKPQ